MMRGNLRPPTWAQTQQRIGRELTLYRRLLQRHKLGEALFTQVGAVLQAHGLEVGTGTIVDATIIDAPSSTKNADGQRDPEMHQTRKGNQWFFGMKLHIGVDARTGLAHSAVATAANVHDTGKHASRSERSTYIPTIDVLRGLRKEGFEPFMVAQGASRVEGKAEFTKHMIRMRHAGQVQTRSEANGIILINRCYGGVNPAAGL